MFEHKENVTSYMLNGYVHLSKKDYGFYSNICNFVKENKPITSNQNKLFNKLLVKYKRQLTKLGHDIQKLQNLDWKVGVVESNQEFLDAKIFIDDDHINLKAPFNTQFISKFRDAELNQFIWNKTSKSYTAPISTYNLKLAVSFVTKYYKTVVYCPNTIKILEKINEFNGVAHWLPTLVKIKNNFYISCINESLYLATKDIPINDDPKTLFLLSQYGISIDKSVTNCDQVLELAGKYEVTIDLEYMDILCQILKSLEVSHVFTSRDIVYNKQMRSEILLLMSKYGITCSPVGSTDHEHGVLLKNSSSKYEYNKNFLKVITVTNSRPIKVK